MNWLWVFTQVCAPGSGGHQTVNLGGSGSLLCNSPFSGLALCAFSSFVMTLFHSGPCLLFALLRRQVQMNLFITWWYCFNFALTLNGYRAHSPSGSCSDFPRILWDKDSTYLMFVRVQCNWGQEALNTWGWHRVLNDTISITTDMIKYYWSILLTGNHRSGKRSHFLRLSR